MSRFENGYHRCVVTVMLLILLSPLAATLLYAFSSQWGSTVLPDGLTLKWMSQLWQDPRFLLSLELSLLICFGALTLSLLLILPLMFVVAY